jgi:hypothetical protein
MTAQEFIEKYPHAELNQNCLLDIGCPNCGGRSRFRIEARTMFTMTDNGEDDHADLEWGDEASAICEDCGHAGTVGSLRIKGLDHLITLSQKKDALMEGLTTSSKLEI